jgi:NAD(P)H-hydrate epimerase
MRLTRDEVRELDRLALAELGLPGVVLMENAGAGAARIALEMLAGNARARVAVVCGPGNNGGDGWVVARHLANAGHDVRVDACVELAALRGDAAIMARAAQALGLNASVLRTRDDVLARSGAWIASDLVVDALLGTGATGAPRGVTGDAVRALATLEPRPPILALDLPSGFDADAGPGREACVRAAVTATFAAEKVGFAAPGAARHLGRVRVVDIGVPPDLAARLRARGAPHAP